MMRSRRGIVPYPPELARRYRELGYWRNETIPTALGRVAGDNAARIALVTSERRVTYAELDATTDRLATGLLDLGLEPGDAVTLQLGNTAETVEAWYALLKAGLIPVCTLTRHRHHEIDEIARITGARAHILQGDLDGFDAATFAGELAERVPTVEHLLSTRVPVVGVVPLDSLGTGIDTEGARRRVGEVQAETDPDEIAVFQLSGGTTARPKVIPRLHAEYLYNVRARIERWELTTDDVLGYVLPLVHNAGVQTSLHVAHLLGARLVLSDAAPDVFLPLFARERVTRTLLPSGVAASLVDHPSFDEMVAGLDCLALTLGKVPPTVFDRVTALGTTLIQEFGMGEGMIMTHALGDPEAARRVTVGSPISPADEVRLLDPDGNEVPLGEPGELNVRGPYTICGYLDEPERNAEVFSGESFYATGDVMVAEVIDGRVFYRLEDRTKDLINRGGEKINTAEIEMLLVEHPSIAEAAVVAMPDERLGERACVFITTVGDGPTLAEIREHLDALEVAKYKWPERVEIVDELPRTAVGKVAKNVLRETVRGLIERDTIPTGG
jgi:2,3-dihydroxybenzoate-AMP ligase